MHYQNQLLFADETVLVADLEEKLCQPVEEFGRVYRRKKLKQIKLTRLEERRKKGDLITIYKLINNLQDTDRIDNILRIKLS